jgi:hypothetical protein
MPRRMGMSGDVIDHPRWSDSTTVELAGNNRGRRGAAEPSPSDWGEIVEPAMWRWK